MHLTPHRRQAWARTHQHIDDHAVLHRDSFQEEFFGPILRLIPEDIQFFIAVPWSWQEFWLLITGTWLRRHKSWEQKDLGLRTQNYKGPTILPIPDPVPHITDVCSGMHRKSEVWEPALSLSYLTQLGNTAQEEPVSNLQPKARILKSSRVLVQHGWGPCANSQNHQKLELK